MTATSQLRSRAEPVRRVLRWLLPAALLALVPKCIVCVAAYAGLATALGLGGTEICGPSSSSHWSWAAGLSAAIVVMAAIRYVRHRI